MGRAAGRAALFFLASGPCWHGGPPAAGPARAQASLPGLHHRGPVA